MTHLLKTVQILALQEQTYGCVIVSLLCHKYTSLLLMFLNMCVLICAGVTDSFLSPQSEHMQTSNKTGIKLNLIQIQRFCLVAGLRWELDLKVFAYVAHIQYI